MHVLGCDLKLGREAMIILAFKELNYIIFYVLHVSWDLCLILDELSMNRIN